MKRTVLALIALTLINAAQTNADVISTGLVERLQADKGVTTDGAGNVSAWADQSGSGNDASQADPNSRPLFVSNALNGNPVLRFDGDGKFLSIPTQVLSSQQFTIMAVVNDVTTSSSSNTGFREIFSNWTTSNTTSSVFLGTTNVDPTNVRFTDDMGGATDPAHTQTGVGTVTNPASHFILTGVSDLSSATIYQGSATLASQGPLSVRDLSAPYAVGTQGGFEFWNGDIAEILVYDRALSADELQANWAFLDQKYGLSSVPEPSSFALLGMGGIGLAVRAFRRRRAETAV